MSGRKGFKIIFLITVAWSYFGAMNLARAEDPPVSPAPAAKSNPSQSESQKKKVLRFDTLMITGEAAKPQVFYLLNRKKILVPHEPVKRDLLGALEKTVEGDPF